MRAKYNNATCIVVFCFLALCLSIKLVACDMTKFVQTEFATRCQMMLELIEKSYVANTLTHPNLEKYHANLVREWVSFYLSHGKAYLMPPSFTFIASDTWEIRMNESGYAVKAILANNISDSEYEKLKLHFTILKNAGLLAQTQSALSISDSLALPKLDTKNLQEWFQQKLLTPTSLMFRLLENTPSLYAKLEEMTNKNIDLFCEFEKITYNSSIETKATIIESVNKSISHDLTNWKKIFLH